jgi:hypothetical protein
MGLESLRVAPEGTRIEKRKPDRIHGNYLKGYF